MIQALENLNKLNPSVLKGFGVQPKIFSDISFEIDSLMEKGKSYKEEQKSQDNTFVSLAETFYSTNSFSSQTVSPEKNPPKPPKDLSKSVPTTGRPSIPPSCTGFVAEGTPHDKANKALHKQCDFVLPMRRDVKQKSFEEWFKGLAAVQTIKTFVDGLMETPFVQSVMSYVETVKGWYKQIKKAMDKVKEFVSAVNELMSSISEFIQKIKEIPAKFISAILGCLSNLAGVVGDAIGGVLGSVTGGVSMGPILSEAGNLVTGASSFSESFNKVISAGVPSKASEKEKEKEAEKEELQLDLTEIF